MLILDFYVDEPACFGVPPYLSPYCRYTAGALVDAGIPPEKIGYLTVDNWRSRGMNLPDEPELLVVIAGSTVPGKYLGGRIGTVAELFTLLEKRHHRQSSDRLVTLIGGPMRYASPDIRAEIQRRGGTLIRGDVEWYAHHVAAGRRAGMAHTLRELTPRDHTGQRRTYTGGVDRWAEAGAFLTRLHPNFPYSILELETYRGCTRSVFCSFCTEAFYGKPEFREVAGIAAEVAELHRMGNRFYRLGRQADLMTYQADMQDFQKSFPRPVPERVEALYTAVRRACPDLELLHLDNINPGLIDTFPEESRRVTEIICKYNTAGDTAAMGLESVDPQVIQWNDLKVDADGALRAIEIINEFGARREDGVPKLLPGLNFIHGLPGESDRTFEQNYEFLKMVYDRGLMLRRINIRQAMTYEHTRLSGLRRQPEEWEKAIPARKRRPAVLEQKFTYFRDKIRREIDRPMLLRVFPPGTIIKNVMLEARNQGYILGRPLGSYPVTIKIPDDDHNILHGWSEPHTPVNVIVVDAEERSLVALRYPIAMNALGQKALRRLPGCGKKRAARLQTAQPIKDYAELTALLDERPFALETAFDFTYNGFKTIETPVGS
ncbi:MAG: radical SAM protein [Leptospiraceae bacterium]|nr:radical SAM protein [Leptospiraceae bacterium]